MNPQLGQLVNIASKKKRRIIGLMSGTSMDGLDIALCRLSGSGPDTTFELEAFESFAYPGDVYHQLISFARADCLDPQLLCVWHTWLAHIHADYINRALDSWGIPATEVDLIASHGQTLYHAPKHKHQIVGMPNATMQIGDGDQIAQKTGIITISDFRQRDTARGNEGAPLAAYGDYLLFSDPGKHRILLNIGGISNFTWLSSGSAAFPPPSFDTGPGNTLMDGAVRRHFTGMRYDKGGSLAAMGEAHVGLLDELKSHPYFQKEAPKTTGFEVFHLDWVDECMAKAGLILEHDTPGAGAGDDAFSAEGKGRPEGSIPSGQDIAGKGNAEPDGGIPSEQDIADRNMLADRQKQAASVANGTIRAVDLLATLSRLTIDTISDQILKLLPPDEPAEVYVSGGGAYNNTLMDGLGSRLDPVPVRRMDDLGVSADAKEALFFAALANELVCGEDTRLHLGKISFPDVMNMTASD